MGIQNLLSNRKLIVPALKHMDFDTNMTHEKYEIIQNVWILIPM